MGSDVGFVVALSVVLLLACGETSPDEGGGGGNAGASTGGGGTAGGLECLDSSEADCTADRGCESIEAYARGETTPHFVSCRFAGVGDAYVSCNDQTPCGYPSATGGECLLFTSNCLPEGWTMDVSCDSRPDCVALSKEGSD